MDIKCKLGFHDWSKDCEKCSRCGKTENHHDWSKDCQKCSRCGEIRDDAHDWSANCEKCNKCHITREGAHVWEGDKCSVCGERIDVVSLLNSLGDNDENNQTKVVSELFGKGWSRGLVPSIKKYLTPSNENTIRQGAATALGIIGDQSAVDSLINVLDVKKESTFLLSDVARAMRQIADPRAIEILMGWLISLDASSEKLGNESRFGGFSDVNVKRFLNGMAYREVILAIGTLRVDEAIPYLILALQNREFVVSDAAVLALAEFPTAQASLEEIALKKDYHAERRTEAVKVLGKFNNAAAIPTLLQILKEPDGGLSMEAVKALGQIQTQEAYDELLKILQGDDVRLSRGAAGVLDRFGEFGASSPLRDALKSTDKSLKQNAAHALANLGDLSARDELVAMQTDKESKLACLSSLVKLKDSEVYESLINMLNSTDEWERSSAAEELGDLGDARAIPKLIPMLSDSKWSIKLSAAASLAMLGDLRGVDLLLHGLWLSGIVNHQEETAIKALGHVKNQLAVNHLVHALRGANKKSRQLIMEAMVNLGLDIVKALKAELEEESPIIRIHAKEALERLTKEDVDLSIRNASNEVLEQIK